MRYLPSCALTFRIHRPRRADLACAAVVLLLAAGGGAALIIIHHPAAAAGVLLAPVLAGFLVVATAPARRRRQVFRDCSRALDEAVHDMATTGIHQIEDWLRHPTR
jgi:hypothetical protein